MTATPRRRCPVCLRRVQPTTRGTIFGHWDSIGRAVCPASWEPYDITVSGTRAELTIVEPGREITHDAHTERIIA